MFKFDPVKKRYTDPEMWEIVRYGKRCGIDTAYADIYMYYVSNLQIVKHICDLLTIESNKSKEAFIPPENLKIKLTVY